MKIKLEIELDTDNTEDLKKVQNIKNIVAEVDKLLKAAKQEKK